MDLGFHRILDFSWISDLDALLVLWIHYHELQYAPDTMGP